MLVALQPRELAGQPVEPTGHRSFLEIGVIGRQEAFDRSFHDGGAREASFSSASKLGDGSSSTTLVSSRGSQMTEAFGAGNAGSAAKSHPPIPPHALSQRLAIRARRLACGVVPGVSVIAAKPLPGKIRRAQRFDVVVTCRRAPTSRCRSHGIPLFALKP